MQGYGKAPYGVAMSPIERDEQPAGSERPIWRSAVAVVQTLRIAGHEAVFAGGCVRDQVLGDTPYDYDIATSATPDEVIALFERTVPVGAAFGVVRVLRGEHEFEVATFRTEGGYSDGRRPDSVQWASARDDVLRRDFTINGLLFDPLEGEGTVIDHVGGLEDLRAGVIRAIGEADERFEEDKLRLLRAVRFAARFEFSIEADTWTAICKRAGEIVEVSVERIRDELERMGTQSALQPGFRLLERSGLWRSVLPEVEPTDSLFDRMGSADRLSPVATWSLLCSELAPRAARDVCQRMKLSTATGRHVEEAVEILRAIPAYDTLDIVAKKRLLRRPEAQTALEIAALGSEAAFVDGLAAAQRDESRWSREDLHPETLVTGAELIAAGRSPGPGFKRALEAVEDAQLRGEALDHESALELALRYLDAP